MMNWDDLEPIAKTTPRVQASTYVNNDGRCRLRLSLSASFMKDLGEPTKADIQLGVDGGVCKMRLVFHPNGKFALTNQAKGGARILGIPGKPPIPVHNREQEACDVEKMPDPTAAQIAGGECEAIIILPTEAWEKQGKAAAVATVAPAPKAPVQSSAPQPRTALDAAAYLKRRGMVVKRIGTQIHIEGERMTMLRVLGLVNSHRQKEGLAALESVDDIR